MPTTKVKIWDEEIPLEDVFRNMLGNVSQQDLLKELSRRIVIEKSFQEYKIEAAREGEAAKKLYERFCQASRIANEEQFQEFCRLNNTNRDEVMERLCYQDQIDQLKGIVVSPDSVKETFHKNKNRFDNVSFSLIRVKNEGMAQELYHRLIDDHGDFTEIARQYSEGDEAKNGGLISLRPLNSLNNKIIEQIIQLRPNEISKPFEVQDFHMIIKLEKYEAATLNGQIAQNLRDQLFNRWLENRLKLAGAELILA
ncbi:MAG: peptidylprolyl isomerase [Candidatus Caenarcaniphilales bacterium]|nr:peptidylprolyl isomerase [Candidatus Caenarcaniphilales bacterium]